MKNITIIVLIVLCLFVLCACSATGDNVQIEPTIGERNAQASTSPSKSSQQTDSKQAVADKTTDSKQAVADKALEEIGRVLLGDTPLYDVGIAENIMLSELKRAISSDESIEVNIDSFTVIDLDDDGIKEVVLWLAVNGNKYYGSEILRYTDNNLVYGYMLPYRAFNSLKADGSFSFSSGAGNSGVGKIKFDGLSYLVDKTAFSETHYDSNNKATISYVVRNQEVSQAEYENEVEKQNDKDEAEQLLFSDDNLANFLH